MAFDLETAAHPENLRRIAIDPISRVEGHGKITLLLDDAGIVQQARLHIVEFRGFEKFIQGRPIGRRRSWCSGYAASARCRTSSPPPRRWTVSSARRRRRPAPIKCGG